jgi:uncharacterized membrane protein YfcA
VTFTFALTVVLSAGIGISLGLLGGGGSILAVPLLVCVAGLPAKEAIATSLLVVGATSAAGARPHARAGRVRWPTGLIFGLGGMAGAYAGGRLAANVPSAVLLTGFAVMMLATPVAMICGRANTDQPIRRGIRVCDRLGRCPGVVWSTAAPIAFGRLRRVRHNALHLVLGEGRDASAASGRRP